MANAIMEAEFIDALKLMGFNDGTTAAIMAQAMRELMTWWNYLTYGTGNKIGIDPAFKEYQQTYLFVCHTE